MNALTPTQRVIVLEALERHYDYTRKLRAQAGIRRYSTKDKHDATLRELRTMIAEMKS